jgi:hypothetical protein
MTQRRAGISNRETPDNEARERAEHPQVPPDAPQQEDNRDEGPRDRQTSNKTGTKSIAQKEDASKYTDRAAPPSEKVAGAFGKERSR